MTTSRACARLCIAVASGLGCGGTNGNGSGGSDAAFGGSASGASSGASSSGGVDSSIGCAASCDGGAPASSLRTGVSPSDNFDLSGYTLTIPVNKTGGVTGVATIISSAALAGGYTSTFFYTGSDGAMVFYAPSNGASTIMDGNPDHSRSELREIFDGGDGSVDWTNNAGGTMTATCRVDRSTIDSDEVTIGQIHAEDAPFVLLEYSATSSEIRVAMYAKTDSSSPAVTNLVPNFDGGSPISYSLGWHKSTVSIVVNGMSFDLPTGSSWNDVPVYFKAGAYSAAPSHGNPAGDATQVSFYALAITH
jgi:hypothetical protein